MPNLDVTIVGAGPAGIDMALTLAKLVGIRYGVLKGDRVGESLRSWPAQTRFITPSFHSNTFGYAVNEASSPAMFTGGEHPSGKEYANYLSFIAEAHDLPVIGNCKVQKVEQFSKDGFILSTDQDELHSRFLNWVTGEYQFLVLAPFPGA
ncbi:putative bacillithiol system oxidoreductase, YpdA family [Serratia liquefaciens]|uniref:NAD(P)-binding domain-containing protein n=1 Tax=Serratia liquefaciens TaxID=614 RepID=UPI0021826D47|nr:NAD(P)-binding domain-containing protein [Serratia liquefaciens]CAI2538270.1 putative bacillithiol system oxidoreductase, YpdA family [Serratia liquefaciens]